VGSSHSWARDQLTASCIVDKRVQSVCFAFGTSSRSSSLVMYQQNPNKCSLSIAMLLMAHVPAHVTLLPEACSR